MDVIVIVIVILIKSPNVQSAEIKLILWNCEEPCGDALHTLECKRERRLCHTEHCERAYLCTVLSRAASRTY